MEMIYIMYVVLGMSTVTYLISTHMYYKGKSDGREELAAWVKSDLFKQGRKHG